MLELVQKSIDELKVEYEAAKFGIDPSVVQLVKRGHPVPNGGDIETKVIALRQAWARYRMRMG